MPSLSRLSFWTLIAGFALFVLSSTPLKVISVTEGNETVLFMFAFGLVLFGLLGTLVNREFADLDRVNGDQFDSIWRHMDNLSSDISKSEDSTLRIIGDLERRVDSFE